MSVIGRIFGGANRDIAGQIIGIYAFLVIFNILAWAWAILSFHQYPILLGTAFLAYSFGLRHAVDADHIAAIDNVTRKLMQQGRRPVSIGLFFSLGHSTIVVALSAVVAIAAIAIKGRFHQVESFGGVIGTVISSAFLLVIAALNILVLASIYRTFRRVKSGGRYEDEDFDLLLARRGFFGRLFRGLFRLVDHSWKMYPVGVLFGLGFDTATEIGLLGLSAAEMSKGLDVWSIMIFPALFTAGMSLIDTTDSILMLGAYAWGFAKPIRKLYYNLIITLVSALIALVVGGIELLGLMRRELDLGGPFWNMIGTVNDHFGVLGYIIIGIFAGSWIGAVLLYRLRRYDQIEVSIAE